MRNSEDMETIKGLEYIASVPSKEIIVGMVVENGVLFVATDKHIYKLIDGKRLEIVDEMIS